jgi:hypothetical protein
MPPSKRSAGASDLPDTARVKVEDVKKLFQMQQGYLDNFFTNVRISHKHKRQKELTLRAHPLFPQVKSTPLTFDVDRL